MGKKEEQKNGGWIVVLLIAAFVIGRFSNAPTAETSTPRVSESSKPQSFLNTEPVTAVDADDDNPVREQSDVETSMPQPRAAPVMRWPTSIIRIALPPGRRAPHPSMKVNLAMPIISTGTMMASPANDDIPASAAP